MALDENSSKYIIKEKIKFYRNRAGLTQSETAKRLNIADKKYSYLEKNAKKIPADILNKLAEIFNIEPEDFLPDASPSSTVKLESPHSEYLDSNSNRNENLLLMMYRKFPEEYKDKLLAEFLDTYTELLKAGEISEDIY